MHNLAAIERIGAKGEHGGSRRGRFDLAEADGFTGLRAGRPPSAITSRRGAEPYWPMPSGWAAVSGARSDLGSPRLRPSSSSRRRCAPGARRVRRLALAAVVLGVVALTVPLVLNSSAAAAVADGKIHLTGDGPATFWTGTIYRDGQHSPDIAECAHVNCDHVSNQGQSAAVGVVTRWWD